MVGSIKKKMMNRNRINGGKTRRRKRSENKKQYNRG
jgi:hypothetical protein